MLRARVFGPPSHVVSDVSGRMRNQNSSRSETVPRVSFGRFLPPTSRPISQSASLSLNARPCTASIYQTSAVEASDNRFNRWTVREIAAASSRAPPHNVKSTREEPGWRRDAIRTRIREKFDFLCHFPASPNSDSAVMRDKPVSSAQQAITPRLKDDSARAGTVGRLYFRIFPRRGVEISGSYEWRKLIAWFVLKTRREHWTLKQRQRSEGAKLSTRSDDRDEWVVREFYDVRS